MLRSATVFLGLVALAAAAAPFAAEPVLPGETLDPDHSVFWGGVVHSSPQALAAWLEERGASYEAWAQRHPPAAARLEAGAAIEPVPPPDDPRPEAEVVAVPDEASISAPPRVVLWIFALGLVLLASGAFFASSLAFSVPAPRLVRAVHRRALGVAGAGAVLLLAAVIAYAIAL